MRKDKILKIIRAYEKLHGMCKRYDNEYHFYMCIKSRYACDGDSEIHGIILEEVKRKIKHHTSFQTYLEMKYIDKGNIRKSNLSNTPKWANRKRKQWIKSRIKAWDKKLLEFRD